MESANNNSKRALMSRRRAFALAGSGAAGLAMAALVGCSLGGNKPATSNKPGGASVAGAPAAGAKPKAGGTLKYPAQKDPDSLDPNRLANADGGAHFAIHVYSRLFSYEPGDNAPASGKIIGDIAQRWEWPDPLTLIVHLNPAAKFDQKAPLNGRTVTAEDVVQSWKRFAKESYSRTNLVHSLNPDAAVDSFEAVDDSTVRIKLAFPDSTVVGQLGVWVQPVEGISGKIDLAKEARGSGPFLLDSYKPSISLSYKRNPNWFLGGGERPYIDGVNIPIIPDQAQFETQFRAKNLHFSAVSRPNIPQFAKELSGTEIAVGGPSSQSPYLGMSFQVGQPWHDVRVRRALSMSINRDAYADVIFNPKQLEQFGVKLTTRWNAPITGGVGAFWLDPKSPKFGPAAQYLQHNVAEAAKMLSAAGFTAAKPLEFDNVFAGTYYGTDWPTRGETLQSMVKDAGIKMNLVSADYATEYIPKYFKSKALFKGRNVDAAVHFPPGGAGGDPLVHYFSFLGGNGGSSMVGNKFPELDAMMRKQRLVTNFDESVAGIHDLNRWSVDNMIVIPVGPETEVVDLVWKALRGPQQYRPWAARTPFSNTGSTYALPHYWFQEQI